MGRTKSNSTPTATSSGSDNQEQQTNKAATEIIQEPIAQKSTRKNVPASVSGDTVLLHNNATGLSHRLPASGAQRLAKQEPDKYIIVQDGEGK